MLVHGPVDCDQLDYLLRDSHFTGVKHGVVDHNRLIECLKSGRRHRRRARRAIFTRRNASCQGSCTVQCTSIESQSHRSDAFESSRACGR